MSKEDIFIEPARDLWRGNKHPHFIYSRPSVNQTIPGHLYTHTKEFQDSFSHQSWQCGSEGESSPKKNRTAHSGKSRVKRQWYGGGPKYLEVIVATDYTVVNFHGPDVLEQYILTQMSLVSKSWILQLHGVQIYF